MAGGDAALHLAGIVEESRRELRCLKLDYQAELESEKAEELAEAEAWDADRARMDAEEAEIAEWFASVEVLADAAMFAAGYHRPKRKWRKRRG